MSPAGLLPSPARLVASGPEQLDAHRQVELLGFPGEAWSPSQLEASLSRDHGVALLALGPDAGSPVLGACLGWCIAGEAELERIVVVPDGRRRGLGGALLDRFLERCNGGGAERVFLEVRASNTPAMALYRSRSFTELGRRRAYYRDGEDAVIMGLELASPPLARPLPVPP